MSSGTYIASSFLYINLGCHMMFILKNRLQAQEIPSDKTAKIINDLVSSIFKDHFIKTMMIPQEPLSIDTFKELFRKLAHSSIMKLDNSSMEKLLYLIIMTLKKETFLTSSPLELYSLTIGNLKILQLYTQGTQSQSLLDSTISIFSEGAQNYTFSQYTELKEYLLTLLESYQTKVINFTESCHQNQRGKLVFIRRNKHNQTTIGSTQNHPKLKLASALTKSSQLALKDWKSWKTSLVIDHASQYERQSERRKLNSELKWGGNQKNLHELLKLTPECLNDFEVKLDLFSYGEAKGASSGRVEAVSKETKKQHLAAQSEIKKKIEEQFRKLGDSKEEELDLLDIMDN